MYDFTLQLSLISSLTVIVYIMARALPRVNVQEEPPTMYDYLDQWADRLPLHHVDERINSFLFKMLKRMRVVVMKMDNHLARYLDRVKKNGEKNAHSVQELLNEVNSEKKE